MRPLFLMLSPLLAVFVVFLLVVSFTGPETRPTLQPGNYQVIQPIPVKNAVAEEMKIIPASQPVVKSVMMPR